MPFAALKLNQPIVRALEGAGYKQPTPIQAAAIPEILAGFDVMASAQTGTGKTAAFMLPALQKLSQPSTRPGRGPRVLVLTPTRELAMQVTQAAQKYGRHLPSFRAVSVVGGMPYHAQNRLLAAPMDVLVATPGRLMDQMDSGKVNFSRLEMLVLDEADRMLDMGFIDDVEAIAAKLPSERQTLLFSATLEGRIAVLARNLLREPKRLQMSAPQAKHESIEQRLIYVDGIEHKLALLDHLVRDVELQQAIVFTATKRDADDLANRLIGQGHSAAALHGDMQQYSRNRTLDQLRRGRVRVLVATDVAARGIDVATISHVINFDLPKFAEDYVHRIGRTGRAGQSGIAISLAGAKDLPLLSRIQRFTNDPIAVTSVGGLEARFDPRQMRRTPARSKPTHRSAPPRREQGRYSRDVAGPGSLPADGQARRHRHAGAADGFAADRSHRGPSTNRGSGRVQGWQPGAVPRGRGNGNATAGQGRRRTRSWNDA
jgi:superfamily II DNA/RNA helicase